MVLFLTLFRANENKLIITSNQSTCASSMYLSYEVFTLALKMADDSDGSCENISDSSGESFGVSSEDSMSSCLKESSEVSDGSPKEIRQTKVAKSSTKTPKTTSGKRKRSTRRKITANSLNEKKMDELAAWAFS